METNRPLVIPQSQLNLECDVNFTVSVIFAGQSELLVLIEVLVSSCIDADSCSMLDISSTEN